MSSTRPDGLLRRLPPRHRAPPFGVRPTRRRGHPGLLDIVALGVGSRRSGDRRFGFFHFYQKSKRLE